MQFECRSCGNDEGFTVRPGVQYRERYNKDLGRHIEVPVKVEVGICKACGATAADLMEIRMRDERKTRKYSTKECSEFLAGQNGTVIGVNDQKYVKDFVTGKVFKRSKLARKPDTPFAEVD